MQLVTDDYQKNLKGEGSETPVVISINKIGHVKDELKNMSREDRIKLLRQIADEEEEEQRKKENEAENSLEAIPVKMKTITNEIRELRKELRDIRREVKINSIPSFDIKCREIFTNGNEVDNLENMDVCGECPIGWWGIMIFFFVAMIIFSIFDGGVKARCPVKLHFD